jgi:hypothetical protein
MKICGTWPTNVFERMIWPTFCEEPGSPACVCTGRSAQINTNGSMSEGVFQSAPWTIFSGEVEMNTAPRGRFSTPIDVPVFRASGSRRHLTRTLVGTIAGAAGLIVSASPAMATPTTTFWAPSTATCQGYAVPHITYDTYFRKGPAAGTAGAPGYPIDTGIEIGVIPSGKVQAEVGFDLLLPSEDPFFFNAKACLIEGALFAGSPAISAGFYNIGTKEGVTDYNMFHLMFQKNLKPGGYIAAGLYHGFSDVLFINSEGEEKKTGAMIGGASPDLVIGLKALKKMNFVADVQTGKNIVGAWGFGTNVYFADNVSLLVGPAFYFDKALQPGGSKWLFSVQLDIDIPFGK